MSMLDLDKRERPVHPVPNDTVTISTTTTASTDSAKPTHTATADNNVNTANTPNNDYDSSTPSAQQHPSPHHTHPPLVDFPYHSDSDSSLGARTEQEALKQGGYHPVQIGDTFKKGTYRTLCRLGCGHFSTVWLCLDYSRANKAIPDAHKVVALKIQKSAIDYSEAAKDEIKLLKACQLRNVHIINLIDHFEHFGPNGTHVCLVFDLLGASLLKLIKRFNYKGTPLPLIRRITKHMMQGLHFLHSTVGIIHTDLKPENVLFEIPQDVVDEIELQATQFALTLKQRKQQQQLEQKQQNSKQNQSQRPQQQKLDKSNSGSGHESNTPNNNTKTCNVGTSGSGSVGGAGGASTGAGAGAGGAAINMSKSHRKNYKKRMRAKAKRLMATTIAANKDLSNTNSNVNSNSNENTDSTHSNSQNNHHQHHQISAALPPAAPVQARAVSMQYPQQLQDNLTSQIPVSNHAEAKTASNNNNDYQNHNNFNNNHGNNVLALKSTVNHSSSVGNKNLDNLFSSKDDQAQLQQQQQQQHIENNKEMTVPSVGATVSGVAAPIEQVNAKNGVKPANDSEDDREEDRGRHKEKGKDEDRDVPTRNMKPNTIVKKATHQLISTSTTSTSSKSMTTSTLNNKNNGNNSHSNSHSEQASEQPTSSQSDAQLEQQQSGDIFELSSIVDNVEVFSRGVVKIADLGNACWIEKHFTDDIQTRQYRSPEVILGIKYHTSVDIWSAACVIFELLTGEYLFDPHTGAGYDRDEDHLALMIELLGNMPKYMTRRGEFSKDLFNRNGELRMIKKLDFFPLQEVLEDKYKMDKDDADLVTSFLLPMLRLDPMKRASAQECLSHPFCAEADMSHLPSSPSSSSSSSYSLQSPAPPSSSPSQSQSQSSQQQQQQNGKSGSNRGKSKEGSAATSSKNSSIENTSNIPSNNSNGSEDGAIVDDTTTGANMSSHSI